MINIGFDGQIYFAQKHGGIKNYFTNLIEFFLLDKSYGVNPIFYFVNRNKSDVPEKFKLNKELEFRGISNIFDVVTPRFTKKPISLIHQTYYFPNFNKLFPYVPHVTTIHDMIPEILPQKNYSYNPHFAKNAYFKSSDGVICVSDTTLKDLKKIYGESNKKTKRIYHGVNKKIFYPMKTYCKEPFLLYVGKRGSYKNGILAIAAMQHVPAHIRLIFIGGGKFSKQEMKLISSLNLENRISQIDANELELASYYRRASALIITSKYEGFGLPAIEAMASGCPVIAAESECLVEICNESAAYFDPKNIESLSNQLNSLLTSRRFSEGLSEKGISNAGRFSWEKCALETANFYYDVMSQNENE